MHRRQPNNGRKCFKMTHRTENAQVRGFKSPKKVRSHHQDVNLASSPIDRQLVRHDKFDESATVRRPRQRKDDQSLHASDNLTRRQSNAFSLAAEPHEEHHRLYKGSDS